MKWAIGLLGILIGLLAWLAPSASKGHRGIENHRYPSGHLWSQRVNDAEGNLRTFRLFFDDSQKLALEAHFFHNELHGNYGENFPDGTPKERVVFKLGRKHGPTSVYAANGQLLERGNYFEGARQGRFEQFYPSGKRRLRETYEAGDREGPYTRWFESGIIAESSEYRRGEKHGVETRYHDSGTFLSRAHFAGGEPRGPTQLFDPDGFILWEGVQTYP